MSKFKPSRGTLSTGSAAALLSGKKPPRTSPEQWRTATAAIVDGSAQDIPSGNVVVDEPANPAREFALRCTLLFLYFRFSFVHEFVSSILHVDTHILIVLGVLSYVAWLVAGNMFAAFGERLAWLWTGLVGWMLIATVTSSWRGGSAPLILSYVRTVYPLMLLIPAVVTRPQDLKRVMNTLAYAGATTILFGLLHRSYSEGRLDVGSEGSTIQDPNDFAAHILIMLPVIALYAFAQGRSVLIKAVGAFFIAAGLFEIVSTGSRGGFVALMGMTAYVALTGSSKIKIAVFLGLPFVGLCAFPLVPQQARARILSLFDSSEASEAARESSNARRALLMASLTATATHPLFGVGPGTFQEYQASLAAQSNQKGMWHETHNGYTQLSAECGIPAFLLYVSAIYVALSSLRRASRTGLPVIAEAARTLAVMISGFSVSLLFLAQGYRFTMLVVAAITVTINQMVKRYGEQTA